MSVYLDAALPALTRSTSDLHVRVIDAVFHRVVDHHRCSSDVSQGGRVSSRLSHVWGHSYTGLSHVRTCTFSWGGETGKKKILASWISHHHMMSVWGLSHMTTTWCVLKRLISVRIMEVRGRYFFLQGIKRS